MFHSAAVALLVVVALGLAVGSPRSYRSNSGTLESDEHGLRDFGEYDGAFGLTGSSEEFMQQPAVKQEQDEADSAEQDESAPSSEYGVVIVDHDGAVEDQPYEVEGDAVEEYRDTDDSETGYDYGF